MLDSPMLLLSLSTLGFLLDGFRGSSCDIFTKGTLLSQISFMVKSYGWVACEIILSSPGIGFPSPVPDPVAWQLSNARKQRGKASAKRGAIKLLPRAALCNSVNAPSLIENPASYFVTIPIQTNQTKEESAVLYPHSQVLHSVENSIQFK